MREIRYLISDASKRIETEAHVLRYWEDELNLTILRNELGHRYYREEDIELLMSIKRLKDKGFQLKAIRMLMPDIKKIDGIDEERLLDLRNRLDTLLGINKENEDQMEAVYKELDTDECRLITQQNADVPEAECKEEVFFEEDLPDCLDIEDGPDKDTYVPAGRKKRDTVKENRKIIDVTSMINVESEIVENDDGAAWSKKMADFRTIMSAIMSDAVQKNNSTIVQEMNQVVSDSVRKEMDYLLHLKEEREEERFKKLDRTIREYQVSRQQSAASAEFDKKRKSKFFKKNKVRI